MPDTDNVVQLSKIFGVSTDYPLNDNYQSDGDIPAVKTSSKNLKESYRSKFKIASYWLISVGIVGVVTL